MPLVGMSNTEESVHLQETPGGMENGAQVSGNVK